MAKKILVCKCCGKEYSTYKENSNYCSHECRIKDNTYYHKCEFCGKEFRVTKSIHDNYVSGKKKHLYCSKECTDKAHTKRVVKICEECGKEFEIGYCFKDIQKYCSRECYEHHRERTKIKKTCPICGKEFYPERNDITYCSNECKFKSRQNRVLCKCEVCGKEFERIKSEVDKNEHHYCSRECKYEAIRWSLEDLKILKDNYGKIKNSELKVMLNKERSVKEISRKAREMGYAENKFWSENEVKILKDNYSTVPFSELQKLLPNRSIDSILGKAHTYGLCSYFYWNYIYSDEDLNYLKNNYLNMTDEELAKHLNRTSYAISQKLLNLGLYRPHEIKKGGYKDLHSFVRSKLFSWKDEVRKENNYTCCITGSHSNLVIHHCRGFNVLIEETIEKLDFPNYSSLSEYTDEQLEIFVSTFLDLQEYYHSYVCITEDLHKLFHKIYGCGNNTVEQWEEFVKDYKSEKYNN